MAIPHGRAPSPAEQAGWRRFWDGWIICPACKANHGDGYTPQTWRVPETYDTAIRQTDRCMKCRLTPADPARKPPPLPSPPAPPPPPPPPRYGPPPHGDGLILIALAMLVITGGVLVAAEIEAVLRLVWP